MELGKREWVRSAGHRVCHLHPLTDDSRVTPSSDCPTPAFCCCVKKSVEFRVATPLQAPFLSFFRRRNDRVRGEICRRFAPCGDVSRGDLSLCPVGFPTGTRAVVAIRSSLQCECNLHRPQLQRYQSCKSVCGHLQLQPGAVSMQVCVIRHDCCGGTLLLQAGGPGPPVLLQGNRGGVVRRRCQRGVTPLSTLKAQLHCVQEEPLCPDARPPSEETAPGCHILAAPQVTQRIQSRLEDHLWKVEPPPGTDHRRRPGRWGRQGLQDCPYRGCRVFRFLQVQKLQKTRQQHRRICCKR
mmetsp:Transcript_22012/g.43693  ORF Transcript_22012/g.43693 Transcript_22012/m.43693 type:complete len:296 (-) Transcript_22012:310-1197(-)